MRKLIPFLITQFRDIRGGSLWMGENYRIKLERLQGEAPFAMPESGRHCAAQLLAHLTAWRRDALLKIETGKGELRDSDAANWPSVQELRKKGWPAILREFDESLEAVLQVLEGKDDAFLEETYYDQDYQGEYPFSYLINGLLHHDLYHLGQLGSVVREVTG